MSYQICDCNIKKMIMEKLKAQKLKKGICCSGCTGLSRSFLDL